MNDGRFTTLQIDDPRWRAFVSDHSGATPFHQSAWATLLADCYRFSAHAAVSLSASGLMSAGLPFLEIGSRRRRWVSLPFTDRCGLLARNSAARAEFARQLDEARINLGLRRVEIRDRVDGPGWPSEEGHFHEIELASNPDEIYARFDSSRVKRKLRRAAREGVVVERGRSRRDLVDVFYRLHVETRRRLGVPVQSRHFFELLWERMLARDLGFLLTARLDGRPVASAVFLAADGRVTYKFSASDPRYGNLPGTHAVLWRAIHDSCTAGVRVFDFGRTETGNEGLRTFKLSWGAHEHRLRYTVFAGSPPSGTLRAAHKLLRPVIRRSPGAVARAIGALAYRYTA